jgi:phenylalanyl-tRNA synthetase beta chain
MKISLRWLNDYIAIDDYFSKANELGHLLTAGGIEVEGVEDLAKNFESVVVGHILKKEAHPNADRLSLCQVATGDGVVHQIVCGAQNHSEGDNVVVALPGAVLPGNFVIKRSKIRGIESGGMLCSEKELGLQTEEGESKGILLLPKDAPVGQPFAEYKGLNDILFELKVTPNRADCLSHFGLAREIAAVLGRPTKFPVESLIEDGGSTKEQTALDVRALELCPRYAGRGVRGVKIAASPAWLVQKLESVGIKPINNVVDVTNFVMLELGQPLHAFDVREIRGGQISVANAVRGESFTTLDGTVLTLDGSELTIRDKERAVALAGIIGGKNSGIQNDTTEIFIESAYFTPSAVRRTSRKFGIETDSSYRFARGVNPDAVPLAMNRAALLIQQVAGGSIMGDLKTLTERLGYTVSGSEFVDWMKRLGCEIQPVSETEAGARWSVQPPTFRWDLSLDVDLVEEFARLHGYQHIPETLPALSTMPAVTDAQFEMESKIRRLLQGAGCLQAINYAFTGAHYQEKFLSDVHLLEAFGLRATRAPVKIVNPLNEEINVMRTALVPGLVKNVAHNSRYGNPVGRLFEIGFAHFSNSPQVNSETTPERAVQYEQEARLSFAFWGASADLWDKTARAPLIFELKGVIESLLQGLKLRKWRWVQTTASEPGTRQELPAPDFTHPGQTAALEIAGERVGFIATLHPLFADEYKIRETCAIAELNLALILAAVPKDTRYQPISKFPAVERDIALLMPKALATSTLETDIRKSGGELLKEVRVFDVFEGGQLPAGQRSVAFRLLFQARDATLEDQAINDLRDRIVMSLSEKFGISIR